MSISSANITENTELFQSLLQKWKDTNGSFAAFPIPLENLQPGSQRASKDVIVALRTRPPLDHETENFSSVPGSRKDHIIDPPNFYSGVNVTSAEPGRVVAHVPGMKWNGPTLTHKAFDADLAFNAEVGNDEVYKRTVDAHTMLELVLGGGVGCVLAYGQTGSGKTHTMEAIENLVAQNLFPLANKLSKELKQKAGEELNEGEDSVFEFRVTFLELRGKSVADLAHSEVEEENHRNVEVMEDKSGSVRPSIEEVVVNSTEELLALISKCLSYRRVSPTARNPRSSRSHAVLTIWAKNRMLPYVDEGRMILVDLAGSERYDDSKEHDRVQMEESRENNTSLSKLKDCIRARAQAVNDDGAFVHIPYRSHKLTLLLKPLFDLESTQLTKTIVIAHVSPHLQDSAHSVNTLSYAAPFKVSIVAPRRPPPYNASDPRTWNNDQSVSWLTQELTKLSKKRVGTVVGAPPTLQSEGSFENVGVRNTLLTIDPAKLCPVPLGGKHLSRMYCTEWVTACLEATAYQAPLNASQSAAVLKDALETYSSLGYLWSTARTQTRKAVLTSRHDQKYWQDAEAATRWPNIIGISAQEHVDLIVYERQQGRDLIEETKRAQADAVRQGKSIEDAQEEVERAALQRFVGRPKA